MSSLSFSDIILLMQEGNYQQIFDAVLASDFFDQLDADRREIVVNAYTLFKSNNKQDNSNLFFLQMKRLVGLIVVRRYLKTLNLIRKWPSKYHGNITSDNIDLNGLVDFESFIPEKAPLVTGCLLQDVTLLYTSLCFGFFLIFDDVLNTDDSNFIKLFDHWADVFDADKYKSVYMRDTAVQVHEDDFFKRWYLWLGLDYSKELDFGLKIYEEFPSGGETMSPQRLIDIVSVTNIYTSNLPITSFGHFGLQTSLMYSYILGKPTLMPSYRFDPVTCISPIKMMADCKEESCRVQTSNLKTVFDSNTVEFFYSTLNTTRSVDQCGYTMKMSGFPSEFLRRGLQEKSVVIYNDFIEYAASQGLTLKNSGEPTDDCDPDSTIVLGHWLYRSPPADLLKNFEKLGAAQSRTPGLMLSKAVYTGVSGYCSLVLDQLENNTGNKLHPYQFEQFQVRDPSKSPGLPMQKNGPQATLFRIIEGAEDIMINHSTHGTVSSPIQQTLKPHTILAKYKDRGIAGMNAICGMIGKAIMTPIRHAHMGFVGGNGIFQVGHNPQKFSGRMLSFLELRDYIYNGVQWIPFIGKTSFISYDFPSWDKLTTQDPQFLYGPLHYALSGTLTKNVFRMLISEYISAVPTYHAINDDVYFKCHSLNSGNTRTADGNCFIHMSYWMEAITNWLLSKQDSELKKYPHLIALKRDIFMSMHTMQPCKTDPKDLFLMLYSIAPVLILSDDGVMIIREGLVDYNEIFKFYRERGYAFTHEKYHISDEDLGEYLSASYSKVDRYYPIPDASRILSSVAYVVHARAHDPHFIAARCVALASTCWAMTRSTTIKPIETKIPKIILGYGRKVLAGDTDLDLLLSFLSGFIDTDIGEVNSIDHLFSYERLDELYGFSTPLDMNNRYIEALIPRNETGLTSIISKGTINEETSTTVRCIPRNVIHDSERFFPLRAIEGRGPLTLQTPHMFACQYFGYLYNKHYREPIATEASTQTPLIGKTMKKCLFCDTVATYTFPDLNVSTCMNHGGRHYNYIAKLGNHGPIYLYGKLQMACFSCGTIDNITLYRSSKYYSVFCEQHTPRTHLRLTALPYFEQGGSDFPFHEEVESMTNFIRTRKQLYECTDRKLLAEYIPRLQTKAPDMYVQLFSLYIRYQLNSSGVEHLVVPTKDNFFTLSPDLKQGIYKGNRIFTVYNGQEMYTTNLYIRPSANTIEYAFKGGTQPQNGMIITYTDDAELQKSNFKCTPLIRRILTESCEPSASFMPLSEEATKQDQAFHVCTQNKFGVVHGPPGTGKTTVLCKLAQHYVDLGYKVGVYGYSHSVVDHLADSFINRDNKNYKISARVYPATLSGQHVRCRLRRYEPRSDFQIIFSTLASHVVFDADVIIIDEFSMVNEVFLYNMLSNASTDVRLYCFGDHKQNCPQFPAVLQSESYLSNPLLRLIHNLDVKKSPLLVTLTYSFRLPNVAVELINSHYDGRLEHTSKIGHTTCILFPDTAKRIRGLLFNDEMVKESIYIYSKLYRRGHTRILTTHNTVQSAIEQQLMAHNFTGHEVGIIDAEQGREYDNTIIVIPENSEFTCVPNKINVALSRHKNEMVILANSNKITKQFWWDTFNNMLVSDEFKKNVTFIDATDRSYRDDRHSYACADIMENENISEIQVIEYPDEIPVFIGEIVHLYITNPDLSAKQKHILLNAVTNYNIVQELDKDYLTCYKTHPDNRSSLELLKVLKMKIHRSKSSGANVTRIKSTIARAKCEIYSKLTGGILDLGAGLGQDITRFKADFIMFVEKDKFFYGKLRSNLHLNNTLQGRADRALQADYAAQDLSTLKQIQSLVSFDHVVCSMSLQQLPEITDTAITNLTMGEDLHLIAPCADVLQRKWEDIKIDKISDNSYSFKTLTWEGIEYVIDYEKLDQRLLSNGMKLVYRKPISAFIRASPNEELEFWVYSHYTKCVKTERISRPYGNVTCVKPTAFDTEHFRCLTPYDMRSIHEHDLMFTDTECISIKRTVLGNIPVETVVLCRNADVDCLLMNTFYKGILQDIEGKSVRVNPRDIIFYGLTRKEGDRIKEGFLNAHDYRNYVVSGFLSKLAKVIFQRPVFIHWGGFENDLAFLDGFVKEPGPCDTCGETATFYLHNGKRICIADYYANEGRTAIAALAGCDTFDLQREYYPGVKLGSMSVKSQDHTAAGDASIMRRVYYATDLINYKADRPLPHRYRNGTENILRSTNAILKLSPGLPDSNHYLLTDAVVPAYNQRFNYTVTPFINVSDYIYGNNEFLSIDLDGKPIDVVLAPGDKDIKLESRQLSVIDYPNILSQIEQVRGRRYSSLIYNKHGAPGPRFQLYITEELDIDLHSLLFFGGLLCIITDCYNPKLVGILEKFRHHRVMKLFGYPGEQVLILCDGFLVKNRLLSGTEINQLEGDINIARRTINRDPVIIPGVPVTSVCTSAFHPHLWHRVPEIYFQHSLSHAFKVKNVAAQVAYTKLMHLFDEYGYHFLDLYKGAVRSISKESLSDIEVVNYLKYHVASTRSIAMISGYVLPEAIHGWKSQLEISRIINQDMCILFTAENVDVLDKLRVEDNVNNLQLIVPISDIQRVSDCVERIAYCENAALYRVSVRLLPTLNCLSNYRVIVLERDSHASQENIVTLLSSSLHSLIANYLQAHDVEIESSVRIIGGSSDVLNPFYKKKIQKSGHTFCNFFQLYLYQLTKDEAVKQIDSEAQLRKFCENFNASESRRYQVMLSTLGLHTDRDPELYRDLGEVTIQNGGADLDIYCNCLMELDELRVTHL